MNRDPVTICGKEFVYDPRTGTHKPADTKRDNDRAAIPASVAQRNKRNALPKAGKGCAISERVDIEIRSYRVHTADTDAQYFKPALDGIVDRGVIANDSAKEVRSVRFWAAEKAANESQQKTVIKIKIS
jgi:hypothetical protein